MSQPRILHLIHHLRIGGAERLMLDLVTALAARGFEVHAGCLDDRGVFFEQARGQGIPCHFIGRSRGFDAGAILRLSRLMKRLRVDLLNVHGFSAGLWGRLAAMAGGGPLVVMTAHSVAGWKQPVKQAVCDRLLQPVTARFVAVSGSVKRSLAARGAPAGLVDVIPNGIHPERFRMETDKSAARRALGLPEDRFLVGMTARCSPEKGGEWWVRALALLRAGGEDVHGVLVGGGEELESWKALARRLDIAERMTFAGTRMDVPRWLAAMDVQVCPSLQESFGLAAVEAQAAGVPVVATRVDGLLEVLHDGIDALLVPPGDAMALCEAVRALLRSPELRRRLVEAGRTNAERFTVDAMADRYAALYRRLLCARRPGQGSMPLCG
jgi:glycosyltransferase involved in cell wall biosynthesis